MKISCLEQVLAPYSIPRFRALQTLKRDYTVQVMALGATERMREWQVQKTDLGFEYVEAFPGETVENIESNALAARVTRWLDDSDPQVVLITGYYYAAMRAAARWAKRKDRISVFLGDSHWQIDCERRSGKQYRDVAVRLNYLQSYKVVDADSTTAPESWLQSLVRSCSQLLRSTN